MKFNEMSVEELTSILDLTIKEDTENKIITFLCQLSAYTKESQFNVGFSGPSSSGKSYIPTEIAHLFPSSDVTQVAYCSPTAFFHEIGTFNKNKGGYEIDFSNKIVIFLDQPHFSLLEKLRPLLSHDAEELHLKITDKSQKNGMRTKNVFIKGHPAVIFCTASGKIDEQESTRFLMLSPEINQKKIRESIRQTIFKKANPELFKGLIDCDIERILLKDRIIAIKNENIANIKIKNYETLEKRFLSNRHTLKPRHQRDISRVISIIQSLALLNLWHRKREGDIIVASEKDISDAFDIWDGVCESQEHNLPPYIFQFYKKVIADMWNEKEEQCLPAELTRIEIHEKYLKVFNQDIEDWKLRQIYLFQLQLHGLINQKKNGQNKLVVPPNNDADDP